MRGALIGRERELAVLTECLSAALTGRPQLVLVQGEAGIGKTRLADELVALAAAEGVLGAWGLAADLSNAPPYWPWRQVLRTIGDRVELVALARERRIDAELARLAPDVFGSGDAPTAGGSSVDDRFRLFDAVARLLREVCRRTPLTVVLDDVHWADAPTLLLLQHVTRALTDERLLVVVNARPTGQRHGELLTRLLREPMATVMQLRGLRAPDIGQQLAGVVGHDVDDAAVAEVESLTGGNPFFVAELGRAMEDAGNGRRLASVTPTVRDAIGDRLARLSPAGAGFVQAAAVVGRDFEVQVVATMLEVAATACLELVDEARAAGLVEPGLAPHEHRFVHALVGDAVRAGLSSSGAVRLHRRAAEAIEHHHAHRLGPHLFDIARHRTEAAVEGDAAAAAWIERAGEEAMRQLAYEEGARLFREALRVGGGELEDEDRYRLLVAAGRALHLSGDLGGRLDVCLEAASLARRMGRPDRIAEAALTMEVVGHPGFDLATRRLCEEALAALDDEPTALRARLTATCVETFMFLRDLEVVAPLSEDALAMATTCGDRRALASALHARRLVCAGPYGLEERGRLAARMVALGGEHDDPLAELSGRLWQIDASLEHGDLARVAAEVEALALCAQRVRGPMARFELLRCRAVLAQAQARFADARRLEAEAFTVLDPTGHDVRFTFRAALTMNIGHHLGLDIDALAASRYEGAPDGHEEILGFMGQVAAAATLVFAGRLDQAAAAYRALGPVEGWQPPPHVLLCGPVLGLVVAVALGDRADVAVLHDRLARYRGHHVASGTSVMVYFGPVELWLGIAATNLGRLDDAVRDLEQAERSCAAAGAPGFRAEAQLELATALHHRGGPGDAEQARALLEAAGRCAGVLGMAPFVARIAELSGQVDSASDSTPLTKREREVADLVWQGMANRAIAERLYLSERTVENHVQHILTKLGLSNRSQVAVWVATRKMSTVPE